jgi:transcription elongation GreA/GreB family factor
MTKQQIHQAFLAQITTELSTITAAAKGSIATATDKAHQAEGKYDTFSLESSYLARGQAKRVDELSAARERLQLLPLKELDNTTPIMLSALIRLEAGDDDHRTIFIGPAAGGETLQANGETITIVTTHSPLGRALLGKKTGDAFKIKLGPDTKHFTILSVE